MSRVYVKTGTPAAPLLQSDPTSMVSSTFKSIIAASLFLALPAVAQIAKLDILYQSLDADFQKASTADEITLN